MPARGSCEFGNLVKTSNELNTGACAKVPVLNSLGSDLLSNLAGHTEEVRD